MKVAGESKLVLQKLSKGLLCTFRVLWKRIPSALDEAPDHVTISGLDHHVSVSSVNDWVSDGNHALCPLS